MNYQEKTTSHSPHPESGQNDQIPPVSYEQRASEAVQANDHEGLIRVLEEWGVTTTQPDGPIEDLDAVLTTAIKSGNREMVKTLVAHGAHPGYRTRKALVGQLSFDEATFVDILNELENADWQAHEKRSLLR